MKCPCGPMSPQILLTHSFNALSKNCEWFFLSFSTKWLFFAEWNQAPKCLAGKWYWKKNSRISYIMENSNHGTINCVHLAKWVHIQGLFQGLKKRKKEIQCPCMLELKRSLIACVILLYILVFAHFTIVYKGKEQENNKQYQPNAATSTFWSDCLQASGLFFF